MTTYKYVYINIVGSMSIRPAPNVNNDSIGKLLMNIQGYGNELTVYPNGDKWLKIEQGGSAVGWVAVIHLGKPYGKLTEIPVTPPDPTPVFPESFILTDPSGAQAEYVFVRVVE